MNQFGSLFSELGFEVKDLDQAMEIEMIINSFTKLVGKERRAENRELIVRNMTTVARHCKSFEEFKGSFIALGVEL